VKHVVHTYTDDRECFPAQRVGPRQVTGLVQYILYTQLCQAEHGLRVKKQGARYEKLVYVCPWHIYDLKLYQYLFRIDLFNNTLSRPDEHMRRFINTVV
jgi:hypothetical protein